MTETTPSNFAAKYNLDPAPQSVARLGQLVTSRNLDIKEIVKVISGDIALKVRLLRAANPSDGSVKIDSIEEAVLRAGIGCVLMVAMSDPLVRALTKTFMALANVKLEPTDAARVGAFPGVHYSGSAQFTGRASGAVHIRLQERMARHITSQVLATSVPEEIDDGTRDVLSELVNMVVGNLKSNLCDAGLDCKLGLPEITQVSEFHLAGVTGAQHQVFAFRSAIEPVLVDLSVKNTE